MDIQNILPFQAVPLYMPLRNTPAKGAPRLSPAPDHKSPGNFISAISHEIRAPLTNINLSVELLQDALQDSQLKTYLDIIMRSSARINDLVTDMLKSQLPE